MYVPIIHTPDIVSLWSELTSVKHFFDMRFGGEATEEVEDQSRNSDCAVELVVKMFRFSLQKVRPDHRDYV